MRRIIAGLALAAAAAIAAAAAVIACGGGGSTVALVAYSTPREAYAELIPAFQKTDAGSGVKFDESYGSSGEQSRAVEAGLPADVVEFSLEPDMTRLVDAGLVAKDWSQNDYDGFVTKSVVVLVVRKGNPKHITGWADLTKPDVEVIEPNPFTSGGAKWNIMAAYGAQLKQGKTEDQAKAYLKDLFDHVPVQDKSAREALQTFIGGKGDVLLSYENEALAAQQAGEDVEYIVPPETILIENPLAVTEDAASSEVAKAFYDFLYTPEAQKIFVSKGYRPVVDGVAGADEFPTPAELFTIADFGGWSQVNDTFFATDGSVMATIEQGLGVSTSNSGGAAEAALTPAARRPASHLGGPALSRPAPAWVLRRTRVRRSTWAGVGLVMLYLSIIVLLPLAAVVWHAAKLGPAAFVHVVSARDTLAALELSLLAALLVAAINAAVGTVIAWVLVRDDFPGKTIVNALIDLPFALPTIVAGLTLLALYGPKGPFGVNLAYTRGAVLLALLFVTMPFVVRSVQPVLMELEREAEEAAGSLGAGGFTVFRRIVLPSLLPAIISGAGLSFARAIGEFGSVVLISGNIPFKTQIAPVRIFGLIESGDSGGAAAVSVVLLLISFAVLLALTLVQAWGRRVDELD